MEINKLFLLFSILLLYSCSDNNFEKIKTISKIYQERNKQILEIKKTDLNNIDYSVIEVRSNDVIKRVLMLPVSSRKNYINYSNGGSQSLTLNGAVISKTIGFNAGLISLEAESNSPLVVKTKLSEWPMNSVRKYDFITHLNSNNSFIFSCSIVNKGDEILNILEEKIKLFRMEEHCKNNLFSFVNKYWASEDGTIKKTTQRVSEKRIYLTVTFLK